MRLKLHSEWELGERIDGGGFGEVDAAKSSTNSSAVAKLVPKAPGADRELLFVNPEGVRNVVPVIDNGEFKDSWVLVMPRPPTAAANEGPIIVALVASDGIWQS
jgi:hypothetical protein